jgi:hypothetical protein
MPEQIPSFEITDVVKDWRAPVVFQTGEGKVYVVEGVYNRNTDIIARTALGNNYQTEAIADLVESGFKTVASGAGDGWAWAGLKILVKSVGTTFKEKINGATWGHAFEAGFLINAFNPSNLVHAPKKGSIGQRIAHGYDQVLRGDKQGNTKLARADLAWNPIQFNIPGLPNKIRPWSTEVGAYKIETKVIGHRIYETLYSTEGEAGAEVEKAETALHSGTSKSDFSNREKFPIQTIQYGTAGSMRLPTLEEFRVSSADYANDENYKNLVKQGFIKESNQYWESKHNITLPQYIELGTFRKEIKRGTEIEHEDLQAFERWNYNTMQENAAYLKALNNGTISVYGSDPLINDILKAPVMVLTGANYLAAAAFGTAATGVDIVGGLINSSINAVLSIPDILTTGYNVTRVKIAEYKNSGNERDYWEDYYKQHPAKQWNLPNVVVVKNPKSVNNNKFVPPPTPNEERNNLIKLVKSDTQTKNNNIIIEKKQRDDILNYIKTLPKSKSK